MKKYLFIFLILVIFLFACSDTNEHHKEKDTIEIQLDSYTISAGEEVYINVKSSKLGTYVYISSDEKIASVDEFGFLTALKPGTVTITVYLEADESLKTSIELTVTDMMLSSIKVNGLTMGHVGDVLDLKYTQYPRGMEEALTFSSTNESIASVDKDGKVSLLSLGQAEITITSESGYTQSFNVGAFDFSSLVVSNDTNHTDGEKISYKGIDYYFNYTYLTSLKDACKYIDEEGSIYVLNGTYNEDFIVSKKGVKLIGTNDKDNPSIITGSLVISNDLSDIAAIVFDSVSYTFTYTLKKDIDNNVKYIRY